MGAQYYEGTTTTETVTTVPAYVDTSPSLANWGSIVAGVFSGIALLVLLSGLGAAIGFQDTLWRSAPWILAGLFGGWVMGRCARTRRLFLPGISAIVGWGFAAALILGYGAGFAPAKETVFHVGHRVVTAGWIQFASMILSLGAMYAGARIGCREEALVVREP